MVAGGGRRDAGIQNEPMADVERPQPRRWPTLAGIAAPVLAVAIVALVSSRGHSEPPPTPLPTATPAPTDELPIVSKSLVASDPRSGDLVLVGCCGPAAGGAEPASTWVWTRSGWTHLDPATAPPFHPGAAFAFDPSTATFLLQGGEATSDTWSWDGRTWTRLEPRATPPSGPAVMTYDPVDHTLVLLTGAPGADVETWRWDGRTWTPIPAPLPSLGPFALAADPVRGLLVLVAGGGCAVDGPSQTWTFDGHSWSPVPGPPCDPSTQLGWDPVSRNVVAVLLGDSAYPLRMSAQPATIWQWSTAGWSQVLTESAPEETGRFVADGVDPAVFVSDRRTGGRPDLWLWTAPGWERHPGGRGVPGR